MRLVFFGSGEFAVPGFRKLLNLPHEVVQVVTQPDRPAGRGKKVVATPVALQAQEEGLPVVRCADVNEPAFVEQMRALDADLGVVIAFGQKLGEPLRKAFRGECVNVHGSLLPKYRGAAPVHWAILRGETKTGVTVFRMVDPMDAGPILVQRETQIGPEETCGELHDRLARIGCDAIEATLRLFEQDPFPPGTPQDDAQATRAPKLKKHDGYLRFEEPAEQIARHCRAMTPWPGARCRFVPAIGEPVEVTLLHVTAVPAGPNGGRASRPPQAGGQDMHPAPPGVLTNVLTVATGEGTLEIHGLQPAGKRAMNWQDFVNGRHVRPGDRFETLTD